MSRTLTHSDVTLRSRTNKPLVRTRGFLALRLVSMVDECEV